MKLALGVLLVLVAVAGLAMPGAAAGNAVLAFAPVNTSAHPGNAIAIDVTVANLDANPGLAQYDLTLHIDRAFVRIDSLTDSGFITTGENIVICVPGTIDNAAGTAAVSCQVIPLFGLPGVSTSPAVVLLHASLSALAPGTSALTLSGTLGGPAGTDIPATFGSGSVAVTSPAPAASPTARASATPTLALSPIAVAGTSTPGPQPTIAPNSPPPAPPTAAAAAALKAPRVGGGGSNRGVSWALPAGAILGIGGLVASGAYVARRRGRARRRT